MIGSVVDVYGRIIKMKKQFKKKILVDFKDKEIINWKDMVKKVKGDKK